MPAASWRIVERRDNPDERMRDEERHSMNNAAKKRSGLGRGLASLIPTGPAEEGESATLGPRMGDAAADVMFGGPSPRRSRRRDEPGRRGVPRDRSVDDRPEPAAAAPGVRRGSARRAGALDPRVRSDAADRRARRPGYRQRRPRYQLVMGERRWRAAQQAGVATIPAIVRETADDSMLRDALLENIHRVQLNPLEEAAAYQQLLEEFDVTHDELAVADRPVAAGDHQHDPVAAAADRGAAPGRRRRAVGRPCAGAVGARGRSRGAGGARRADRRRGPVGPRDRGGGHAGQPRRREQRRRRPAASRSRCRGCRMSPNSCRRPSTPG